MRRVADFNIAKTSHPWWRFYWLVTHCLPEGSHSVSRQVNIVYPIAISQTEKILGRRVIRETFIILTPVRGSIHSCTLGTQAHPLLSLRGITASKLPLRASLTWLLSRASNTAGGILLTRARRDLGHQHGRGGALVVMRSEMAVENIPDEYSAQCKREISRVTYFLENSFPQVVHGKGFSLVWVRI